MIQFVEHVRDDGNIELRHPNYDEIVAQPHPEPPQDFAVIPQEEVDHYFATQYQRDRQREYPPITDYIDGVVKGDQAQIDAYVAACLAVKEKYPKPVQE